MKPFIRFLFLLFVFVGFFAFANFASADTSPYRSAATITTDGDPSYTNLSNCSATDGNTCDRAQNASSYANLYFRDFGDFGIPDGSTITQVRILTTGRTNIGPYAGVSPGRTYTSNCQTPSDLWTMYILNSATIAVYNVTTPLSNGSLAFCLSLSNIKSNNFIFRINYSGIQNWYANIDNFEIAFDYTTAPTPTPSPTPTLTPTPTPTLTPAPFLDLPWDYEAKGLTFSEAALSMSAFFDHEYPLLSSGLSEPIGMLDNIRKYDGSPRNDRDNYSSHDGYDYAIGAKVYIGDPVLAAAAGTATYINSCSSCGNMVVIDHGNGYQTRYMHLQYDGLITTVPNTPVHVNAGQPIGKVGATGNVQPAGDAGAHIHFGVFEDKNHDGNFEDNIPDGVTDPFGWQSKDPDPWENYSFLFNGQRTGNKSYYLWKKRLDGMTNAIAASNGGTFSSGNYNVSFPQNAFSVASAVLNIQAEATTKISDSIISLIPGMDITLKNTLGDLITFLNQPMGITVDFSKVDTNRFKIGTISIYSSQDGSTWIKEDTFLDYQDKKASANINHLTHFALFGERADTMPPETSAVLSGDVGGDSWYRSNVDLSLEATDNPGGLGVDYTLYKKDSGDWDTDTAPINLSEEGHHKIEFYSVDRDGNIEGIKSVEFDIDKTPPTITSELKTSDGQSYIPGYWTNKDIIVSFSCTDSLSGVLSFTDPITLSNEGGSQSVTGQCQDRAGNIATDNVSGINIDKTSPRISIYSTPSIIWPPNGKFVPVIINGSIDELHLASKSFTVNDEYGKLLPVVLNFGDTIFLEARRNDDDFDGRHYVIKVTAQDLAGNASSVQTQIIVPHDQGN